MSIEELLDMTSTPMVAITDLSAVCDKIHAEFSAATTSDQRGALLGMFKAATDLAEGHVAKTSTPEQLAKFQKTCAYDYKAFIVEECLVGGDSPGGGDISVERLMAVTNREIAAGRMTEDHSMRKIAVECAAAPHLSHGQLLEKHAKLEEEQAAKAKAEAFGAVVGRKLKGLFRSARR